MTSSRSTHARRKRSRVKIGQRYGDLVVEEFAGYSGANLSWLCRCACGTLVILRSGQLLRGERTTCERVVHGAWERAGCPRAIKLAGRTVWLREPVEP